jgi:hypothetical protein
MTDKYPTSSIGFSENKVECHTMCGFNGKIELYEKSGGVIYENPDRVNIFGSCPKCGTTLISFYITKK